MMTRSIVGIRRWRRMVSALTARGPADGLVFAVVNAGGEIETSWHAAGPGREEITALSAIPVALSPASHTPRRSSSTTIRSPRPAPIMGRPAP
jgi:hypothetical protein